MEISAVYKIINTVTGYCYIGSSKDVNRRWAQHKRFSTWKNNPNKQLYKDMQKYGVDSFELQILEEVEPEQLKEKEQQLIETLKPTYNSNNAKGLDVKNKKEYNKKYKQSDKYKDFDKKYKQSDKYKEYQKAYRKSDKYKKYHKEYNKSDKYKEYQKEYQKEYKKKYYNQLCLYNGETLTLNALYKRLYRAGISNPAIEAKKYLVL